MAGKSNSEAHRRASKKWRVNNPDASSKSSQKYYENNKERIFIYKKNKYMAKKEFAAFLAILIDD